MTTMADAALAQIQAAPVSRVYKMGSVPSSPAYPYLTVATSYDSAETYTLDATHAVSVQRVTTQSVGTTLEAATDTDNRARRQLLDKYLTVNTATYGPGRMQVGAAIVRDPDGGALITVTSTYLFATTEE